MERLETIAESIHQALEARNAARDRALSQARTLTRHCANAIRAVHRDETDLAQENLGEARRIAQALRTDLMVHPELYYAGYTQDALKEFAEASIVYALVQNVMVPTPNELDLENSTYLNGLAVRPVSHAVVAWISCATVTLMSFERLLSHMEDIYAVLTTMDYPDAITVACAGKRISCAVSQNAPVAT
jgi:translin